jgi:hypothetical protein
VHISGLKHGVLKLFMSYNPLWLRIGLEIVCDTLIPMKSHTDLNTLTYFLINRYVETIEKHSVQFLICFIAQSFVPQGCAGNLSRISG